MYILVTGSNGQLGKSIKDLVNAKKSNHDFVFSTKDQLDLSNFNNVRHFIEKNHFDVIINCAAYTLVDKAEGEKEEANLINNLAVSNLAEIASDNLIKLIHISTDFVFDGLKLESYNETDITSPVNEYGRSKLAGEKAVLLTMKFDALIIRTCWVYSEFGNNFVDTIIKNANLKGQLNIISDQFGTPTYANDLAQTIIDILDKNKFNEREMPSEIYHYSNEGECTWFDFAKEIVDILQIDCNLSPITSDDYPQLAKRPKYSVLSKKKISEEFDLNINYWKDSLKRCLKNLKLSNKFI